MMIQKRKYIFFFLAFSFLLLGRSESEARSKSKTIVLNGNHLSAEEVVQVASGKVKVRLDKKAMARVKRSQEALLQAATEGQKIYGLTVGVGENKDVKVLDTSGGLTEEVLKASEDFNRALFRSHSAAAGPNMDPEVVRAIMVVRLNSVLFGSTGAQPHVARLYRAFLNHNVIPEIPSQGSVGEADITVISHVGLAMMGEGYVQYKGKRMKANEALKALKLEPLVPYGRDALTILSSNAYSAALASFVVVETKHLLNKAQLVFALSIQGLNGNIEPFLKGSNQVRPFPYANGASARIRALLNKSSLWEKNKKRALQDPLSFRTAAYTFGSLARSLAESEALLKIQLNSSDDNPGVLLKGRSPSKRYEEASHYNKKSPGGAVLPTANFSPLIWVVAFEELAISMAHASNASAQRTIKLSDSHFTGLTRFLSTPESTHAYGAIQKTFASLASENRSLANPVSYDYYSIAGNIEDTATNAPRVMRRMRKMIDNFYYILGMELMHAAQAMDLRAQKMPEFVFSPVTAKYHENYRKVVSFMTKDRILSYDIAGSYKFLRKDLYR